MKNEFIDMLRSSSVYADYLASRFPNAPMIETLQSGVEKMAPILDPESHEGH